MGHLRSDAERGGALFLCQRWLTFSVFFFIWSLLAFFRTSRLNRSFGRAALIPQGSETPQTGCLLPSLFQSVNVTWKIKH